jgi:hypothetical protein
MEQAAKRARLSGAEGTVAGSGVLEPVELVEPTAAHHDAKLAEPAASATDQTCVIMSRADGAGEGATSSHQQQQQQQQQQQSQPQLQQSQSQQQVQSQPQPQQLHQISDSSQMDVDSLTAFPDDRFHVDGPDALAQINAASQPGSLKGVVWPDVAARSPTTDGDDMMTIYAQLQSERLDARAASEPEAIGPRYGSEQQLIAKAKEWERHLRQERGDDAMRGARILVIAEAPVWLPSSNETKALCARVCPGGWLFNVHFCLIPGDKGYLMSSVSWAQRQPDRRAEARCAPAAG